MWTPSFVVREDGRKEGPHTYRMDAVPTIGIDQLVWCKDWVSKDGLELDLSVNSHKGRNNTRSYQPMMHDDASMMPYPQQML